MSVVGTEHSNCLSRLPLLCILIMLHPIILYVPFWSLSFKHERKRTLTKEIKGANNGRVNYTIYSPPTWVGFVACVTSTTGSGSFSSTVRLRAEEFRRWSGFDDISKEWDEISDPAPVVVFEPCVGMSGVHDFERWSRHLCTKLNVLTSSHLLRQRG